MQFDEKELTRLLEQELLPNVKAIDRGKYPAHFLKQLGGYGYFKSKGKSPQQRLQEEIEVVEQISSYCMTTGFLVWCQLAAITYIRHTSNAPLQAELLSRLENVEQLAGTGLSNPMKYYGGLEKLHLTAEKTEGGYLISGALPSVSNIGKDHLFAIVASTEGKRRVMLMVDAHFDGLSLKDKSDYLGINGSGTYACRFNRVFVPARFLIAEDADQFIPHIRPYFLAYQIPLGLGVAQASIAAIQKARSRQFGCNSYLRTNPDQLLSKINQVKSQLLTATKHFPLNTAEIAAIRLKSVYTALETCQTEMLHVGGPAYLKWSNSSRRLREAYFMVNLTPTVRHLEKLLGNEGSV